VNTPETPVSMFIKNLGEKEIKVIELPKYKYLILRSRGSGERLCKILKSSYYKNFPSELNIVAELYRYLGGLLLSHSLFVSWAVASGHELFLWTPVAILAVYISLFKK
jgi:hypothetical protein